MASIARAATATAARLVMPDLPALQGGEAEEAPLAQLAGEPSPIAAVHGMT